MIMELGHDRLTPFILFGNRHCAGPDRDFLSTTYGGNPLFWKLPIAKKSVCRRGVCMGHAAGEGEKGNCAGFWRKPCCLALDSYAKNVFEILNVS